MPDYRIASTSDLEVLNHEAVERGLRSLPRETMTALDPSGRHLLDRVVYGHNMDGRGPLHHRCRIMLKITTQPEPVLAHIDVLDEQWDALTTREEFMEANQ